MTWRTRLLAALDSERPVRLASAFSLAAGLFFIFVWSPLPFGWLGIDHYDDRALKLSGILAGSRPRLGGYANASELAEYGVQVVDLSAVGGDRLNHTKFAENPVLVRQLGQRLLEDDGFASDREITDRLLGGALRRLARTP